MATVLTHLGDLAVAEPFQIALAQSTDTTRPGRDALSRIADVGDTAGWDILTLAEPDAHIGIPYNLTRGACRRSTR